MFVICIPVKGVGIIYNNCTSMPYCAGFTCDKGSMWGMDTCPNEENEKYIIQNQLLHYVLHRPYEVWY